MADRQLPSVEYLRQRLRYDATTGLLFWRHHPGLTKRWNRQFAEKEAGTLTPKGYRVAFIEGRNHRVHRLIWAMHYGEWPEGQIDHIDHDRINNRISNLRDVTCAENQRNRKRKESASGEPGVTRYRGKKWKAEFKRDDKSVYIGMFDSKEEAAAALAAARAAYGFHPNHCR